MDTDPQKHTGASSQVCASNSAYVMSFDLPDCSVILFSHMGKLRLRSNQATCQWSHSWEVVAQFWPQSLSARLYCKAFHCQLFHHLGPCWSTSTGDLLDDVEESGLRNLELLRCHPPPPAVYCLSVCPSSTPVVCNLVHHHHQWANNPPAYLVHPLTLSLAA